MVGWEERRGCWDGGGGVVRGRDDDEVGCCFVVVVGGGVCSVFGVWLVDFSRPVAFSRPVSFSRPVAFSGLVAFSTPVACSPAVTLLVASFAFKLSVSKLAFTCARALAIALSAPSLSGCACEIRSCALCHSSTFMEKVWPGVGNWWASTSCLNVLIPLVISSARFVYRDIVIVFSIGGG